MRSNGLWTFNVGSKRKYGKMIEISHRERKKRTLHVDAFFAKLTGFSHTNSLATNQALSYLHKRITLVQI